MKPIYCFTSDIDWAPEFMIENMINIFDENGIPLTLFVTHRSDIIENVYINDKRRYVGIHPNFLSRSTHGSNYLEVIDNSIKLWDGARCFRSHSYYDNSYISLEFVKRNFKYDTNICLYLQDNIVPLHHASGLIRFPTFFDDSFCSIINRKWNINHYRKSLLTNGLKIFNFHPIHICINTPSLEYYELYKHRLNIGNWKDFVYKGYGTFTLLMDIINFVKENGDSLLYLDDLYEILYERTDKFEDKFISDIRSLLGR